MKKLLRRDLWKILLCLCVLTAAAVLLRPHLTEAALSRWLPAPVLAHPALLLPVPVLCLLLLWFLLDRFAFRLGAALIWLGFWLCAALLDRDLPRLAIIAMLPLPLFAGCELCFRLLRPGRPADFAPLRSWLCLILVLVSLLTALLPTPDEPYGYPVIRAIVSKAEEILHDVETRIGHRREGDLEFGLSFNGMESAPETGARPGEEGSLLTVQPYLPTAGPLYLVGNAWDRFDGSAWARDAQDDRALFWNADTLEHVYALWRWQQANGKADDERFFRANSLLIRYGDMETRTMFGSLNALRFFYDEERYPVTAGAGGILFDYLQSEGTAYRMYWLETNDRTIDELIESSEGYTADPLDRRTWSALMDRYEPRFHLDIAKGTLLEDLLARRQEQIRARDLDTAGVSDRAAALAAEITADCRTDLEKLNAIAALLQAGCRYTLSPAPVPEGENFLDWLLFESKEGYCTWFATAAALLARSAGIPARFVQGYRIDALETRKNTVVGPESAHAWCEAWIAGYGWVTVEATPGFSASGEGWAPPEEQAQDEQPQTDPAAAHGGAGTGAAAGEEKPPVHVPQTEGPASGEDPGEAQRPKYGLWVLLLLPPAAALALAAAWALRRWKRRRHYLQSPPEEQVRLDLARLLDDLRRRGHPRAPEDSLRAFFDALPWRFLPAEKEEAMTMAEFYESVLFGGRIPTAEQVAAQRSFVDRFKPSVRRFPRLSLTSIRTRNFS